MKNFVNLVIGQMLIGLVISLPVGIVFGIVQLVIGGMGSSMDPDVLQFVMIGVFSVLGLLLWPAIAFLQAGINDVALRTARGEKTTIGQFFGGGRFVGRFMVGGLLLGLAVGIGELLCVVPGLILALGLSMWTFVAIDRNMGAVDSLKASWEMTKGHKMTIFVLVILQVLCFIAGYIACGLGTLVVAPMLPISNAYAYLKIKGEQPRALA